MSERAIIADINSCEHGGGVLLLIRTGINCKNPTLRNESGLVCRYTPNSLHTTAVRQCVCNAFDLNSRVRRLDVTPRANHCTANRVPGRLVPRTGTRCTFTRSLHVYSKQRPSTNDAFCIFYGYVYSNTLHIHRLKIT